MEDQDKIRRMLLDDTSTSQGWTPWKMTALGVVAALVLLGVVLVLDTGRSRPQVAEEEATQVVDLLGPSRL